MTDQCRPRVFLCNEADVPHGIDKAACTVLGYQPLGTARPMVRLGLPDFIQQVFHLPDRCLDLLELAAYVFAADRLISRGSERAVEYQSWSRQFHFVVKVRDHDFWCTSQVLNALKELLCFATGDRDFKFTFQAGHTTSPTNLFDDTRFEMAGHENVGIVLFSGGLDSLAGAIQRLDKTNEHICLVSHTSQAGTVRTQRALVSALQQAYPQRVDHYEFKTQLQGIRAREETQRSRLFLYGSIAFALATAFSQDHFYIYENGVTSLNFSRREELVNARASRTTHPQTVGRLAKLLSIIAGGGFSAKTPFLWHTKADVVNDLKTSGHGNLLSSSVSCSQTYNSGAYATHCGECFQCLDRRIGIYGAACHDLDNESLYAEDIIVSDISSSSGKTIAVDYLRQAANLSSWNVDRFYFETLDELRLLVGWIPGCEDEFDLVSKIWELYSRHASGVGVAIRRMREIHEELFGPLAANSLLGIISDREFLKTPVMRLVRDIESRLRVALPKLFQSVLPTKEKDLNDKIEGILSMCQCELFREHPSIPFACAGVVPDFSIDRGHVVVEGKYIRGSNSPSKISEGIAADLTKYDDNSHILFVVYDPEHAIIDRLQFVNDFEAKGRCTVCVLP